MVVPFRGTPGQFDELQRRLARLRLAAADSLTVVDNSGSSGAEGPSILVATSIEGSYFARNRGAQRGAAPWIVFLDSDVEPDPGLLDEYFRPAPAAGTAIIAGAIIDDAPARRSALAQRYAAARRSMSHHTVLDRGAWSFAQTANCAVRRAAFEEAGGFCETIRSGGDADLAYRLLAVGWQLEVREAASVVHLNRSTLRAMLRQRAKHGAGAAWLASRHPGSSQSRNKLGLIRWSVTRWSEAAAAIARRENDEALVAALDPLAVWAFELGRLLPNHARCRRQPPRPA